MDKGTLKVEISGSQLVKIAISILGPSIALAFGFGLWMNSIDSYAKSSNEKIIGLEIEQSKIIKSFIELQSRQTNTLHSIDIRLDRIEQKLNRGEL